MKRLFLMGGFICIFALTGCGAESKDIVCTQSTSGVDVELTTKLDGDYVQDMSMKYTMNLKSYSDIQVDAIGKQDFCSIIKTSMPKYSKAFTNCKQDISNKVLLITADFDVKQIDDKTINEKTSAEEVKSSLETEGYSCIIK